MSGSVCAHYSPSDNNTTSSPIFCHTFSFLSSLTGVTPSITESLRLPSECRRCKNACLLQPLLLRSSFPETPLLKPSPTLNSLRTYLNYRAPSPVWVFHLKLPSQSLYQIPMSLLLPSWLPPGSVLSLHRSTLLIGRKNLNFI